MRQIELYTDGAFNPNKKVAGWACLLRYGEIEREISGHLQGGSAQRAELEAAIQGLSLLREPCEVHLVSDSEYLVKGTNIWVHRWYEAGWKKADKQDPANLRWWKRLHTLLSTHKVTASWVKAHSGHPENERCDFLASEALSKGIINLGLAGTIPSKVDTPFTQRNKQEKPMMPSNMTTQDLQRAWTEGYRAGFRDGMEEASRQATTEPRPEPEAEAAHSVEVGKIYVGAFAEAIGKPIKITSVEGNRVTWELAREPRPREKRRGNMLISSLLNCYRLQEE